MEAKTMKRINNYFPENITIPVNAKVSVRNLSSPPHGRTSQESVCRQHPPCRNYPFSELRDNVPRV